MPSCRVKGRWVAESKDEGTSQNIAGLTKRKGYVQRMNRTTRNRVMMNLFGVMLVALLAVAPGAQPAAAQADENHLIVAIDTIGNTLDVAVAKIGRAHV